MDEEHTPLCDYDQYAMLLMCIEEGDFGEWNKWRDKHPNRDIILGGADFQGSVFLAAGLKRLNPQKAAPNLKDAYFFGANFKDADLSLIDLQKAKLHEADLRNATLKKAKLQKAIFQNAWLKKADFEGARLNGVNFKGSHLEGASILFAQVDSETYLANFSFDHETDFTGTSIDTASIDPSLKAAIKDNIRRIKWQEWLNQGNWFKKTLKNIFVRPFWWMTGYGSSTVYILFWFIGLAPGFGVLYHCMDVLGHSFVRDLAIENEPWLQFLRAVYFSVVTMTTLGFGDMYAQKSSYLGHALLMIQVILGYVLLGALVTRFGILFTSEAPAAKPTPIKDSVKNGEQ